ncbi:MAG: MBL fold metallo-hydrolase [Cyclobacteriaceae bacterium]
MLRIFLSLSTIVILCFTASFTSAQNPEWTRPYEPFRIAGNLYYVGTYGLACYLITTSQGNILINTGLAESVPMIRRNIEALGFRYSDIKILLTTHAHFDHVEAWQKSKRTLAQK